MPVNVIGLDHIYLTVSDFEPAQRFYDAVMQVLGFRKGDKPIAGEAHAHYFNPVTQLTIRPAHASAARHDPYAPGLHHICFQVSDRDAVHAVHAALLQLGVSATEPRLYSQYNPDYYATFFADPDGMRFEVVARTPYREELARRWHELEGFLNPLARLHERDAADRGDGKAET
jgi:catechol 2,3-dioxygenase-like lactoylglutathione lyase family enzyme